MTKKLKSDIMKKLLSEKPNENKSDNRNEAMKKYQKSFRKDLTSLKLYDIILKLSERRQ